MNQADFLSRNRANSAQSTGPRSSGGKATVAQNARRHGATAAPDPTAVGTWLRLILDRPEIGLDDVTEGDPKIMTALRLAEAEARLAQCESAARSGASTPDIFEGLPPSNQIAVLIEDLLMSKGITPETKDTAMAIARDDFRRRIDALRAAKKEKRLLTRYVREAHAERRRALSAWVESQRAGSVNDAAGAFTRLPESRNKAKLQP